MAALFGFYLATRVLGGAVLGKTAMGLGDVKLSGILGLLLAWLSWGALVVGAFAGFLVGAVGGIALIASGRGKLATKIPYGPYMLAGRLGRHPLGHLDRPLVPLAVRQLSRRPLPASGRGSRSLRLAATNGCHTHGPAAGLGPSAYNSLGLPAQAAPDRVRCPPLTRTVSTV